MFKAQLTSKLTLKTEETPMKAHLYVKKNIVFIKCYVKLQLKRGQFWQFHARQSEIEFLFLINL